MGTSLIFEGFLIINVDLDVNYLRNFDLNVGIDSIDVDDVVAPTIKLSDAKTLCIVSYQRTLHILVLMK